MQFKILTEWFVWGESDLLFKGIVIMLIAFLLPVTEYYTIKKRAKISVVCIGVYVVSEIIMSYLVDDFFSVILLLFIGGGVLNFGIGGLLRVLAEVIRHKFKDNN